MSARHLWNSRPQCLILQGNLPGSWLVLDLFLLFVVRIECRTRLAELPTLLLFRAGRSCRGLF